MTYLILDNIRSAENVGAIFRTADAAGVNKIYLLGVTPAPIDRFGRASAKIGKAALGAERTVEWEVAQLPGRLISKLKKVGVKIIALEQDTRAVAYKKGKPTSDFALIVGNEVEGVSPRLLKLSDEIIEIPMRGQKESLNVSVATGVALFRLLQI